MASYLTTKISTHRTLTANVVDIVQFVNNFRAVQIKNRSVSSDIFYRLDGTTPVVGADDNYIIRGGETMLMTDDWPNDQVKLISTDAAPYSVTGIDRLQ